MGTDTSSIGPHTIETTMPDAILRHNISDEDLDMLCENKKDFVLEILWIAIGVLLGSLPTALTGMWAYKNSGNLPVDGFIQIILFWLGLVVALVVGSIAMSRGKRAKNLQTIIRERSSKGECLESQSPQGTELKTPR
jgi:hypothetical protein